MFSQKGENLIGVNSDRDSRTYSWSLFNTLCTVSKKEFSNFPHAHVSDLNAATRATLAQINHILYLSVFLQRCGQRCTVTKAFVSSLQALFSAAHWQFWVVWRPH